MFKNEYTLNVDIKRKFTAVVPTFVQNDTATLIFKIFNNSRPYDLSSFTHAEVTTERKDGTVVIGKAYIEGEIGKQYIRYEYMGNEMAKSGFAETALTIFSDATRVSILPFKINIVADIRDAIGASEEYGVLQELIVRVEDALEGIEAVTDSANQAVDSANQAVISANQAITDAEAAVVLATANATLANEAALNADAKAQLADTAATNANLKATLADEKALLAQTSADNANAAILGINDAKDAADLAALNANNATIEATNATTNATAAIASTELATTKANTATTNAVAATTNANQVASDTLLAKNAAQIATNNANTATTNANDAVASVNIAKTNAELATSNANTSATNADSSAQSANSAAANAQMIADNTVSVGDFVLGNLYKKNNLVLNNGSTWIALIDTQNNPLPVLPIRENTWWRLVAQRGVDGTGSVVSVNNISPDVNGNVTLDLGDSITMVDGFSPDISGNVTTHTNKVVLDALTDELGQLKYKGVAVGSVSSVNGQTGAITGLETVADSNAKLDTKVDKVVGKQLSTEDYTTTEKDKLTGVEAGAQVNTVLSVNGQVGNVIGLETTVGVDNKLSNKVDKEIGKQLSTEDYTSIEKDKLAGIENNANNYAHPLNHPPSIIEQDVNNRFVTDVEKSKLNSIEAGAQVNTITSVNGATGAITGLATDISVDNKTGILLDNIGDKTTLTTAIKTDLVNAINEINAKPSSIVDLTNINKEIKDGLAVENKALDTANAINYAYEQSIRKPPTVYGVKIDITNSNPSSALTYTDSSIGFIQASGNNGTFNYGSWSDKFPFNQIKPCVYKNGVVNYYLNPNDYTKRINGASADITSGNDGDVMIEFPKIYWKFETVGNDLFVRYSNKKVDSGYKCLAHTRGASEKEYAYLSAYMGNTISSKLRSLSGKMPTVNQTISTFRTQAQANGTSYDQQAYHQLLMLQVLFVVMFKSRDSQTALGRGYVDGNAGAIATGGTNTKGMFYGETTGKLQNKFCGIEDFWGNVLYWVDGMFSDASRNMLIGTQGFNDTGSGYTNYGQGAIANIGGYISSVQGGTETGFIVKASTGSATTHYTDYGGLSASCLPAFGGSWAYADYAGAFYLLVAGSASSAGSGIGARLLAF